MARKQNASQRDPFGGGVDPADLALAFEKLSEAAKDLPEVEPHIW